MRKNNKHFLVLGLSSLLLITSCGNTSSSLSSSSNSDNSSIISSVTSSSTSTEDILTANEVLNILNNQDGLAFEGEFQTDYLYPNGSMETDKSYIVGYLSDKEYYNNEDGMEIHYYKSENNTREIRYLGYDNNVHATDQLKTFDDCLNPFHDVKESELSKNNNIYTLSLENKSYQENFLMAFTGYSNEGMSDDFKFIPNKVEIDVNKESIKEVKIYFNEMKTVEEPSFGGAGVGTPIFTFEISTKEDVEVPVIEKRETLPEHEALKEAFA